MPLDAKIIEWHGFLGFPTRVRYRLTNMEQVERVSRRQRKRRMFPFSGAYVERKPVKDPGHGNTLYYWH